MDSEVIMIITSGLCGTLKDIIAEVEFRIQDYNCRLSVIRTQLPSCSMKKKNQQHKLDGIAKMYVTFAMILVFEYGPVAVQGLTASACNGANITLYCPDGGLDIYEAFLVVDIGPKDCSYSSVDCLYTKTDLRDGTAFFENVQACQHLSICTLMVAGERLNAPVTGERLPNRCANGKTETTFGLVDYRCSDAETTTRRVIEAHTTKPADPVVIALSVVAVLAVIVAVVVTVVFCLRRNSTTEISQSTSSAFNNRAYNEADFINESRASPHAGTDLSASSTYRVSCNKPPLGDATYSTIDDSVVPGSTSGRVDTNTGCNSACITDPDGYDIIPCDKSSVPPVNKAGMNTSTSGVPKRDEDKDMTASQSGIYSVSTYTQIDDVDGKDVRGTATLLEEGISTNRAEHNESDIMYIVDNETYEPFRGHTVEEDGAVSDTTVNNKDEAHRALDADSTKVDDFETVIIDNVDYAGTIQHDA